VDGCVGTAPVHLRARELSGIPASVPLGILGGVQAPPSFRDLTLGDFAERLASPEPVPGGGSASAVAAALGSSLVAMVATLSQGRPKYAEHSALHDAAAPAARRLSDELLALADEDAEAYAACAFALKLPREAFADKEYRDQQVRATAQVAAEVPLRCVEKCREALVLAEALAGRSNVNASSDLRVAALLLQAAGHGAAENVLVNLPLIGTNEWTQATERRVGELLDELVTMASQVHDLVSSGERRAALDAIPEAVASR
jgi:formiminotetrahydrofolate cyclodeaminase